MDYQNLPDFAPVRVELTSGIVTEATIHNSAGVHPLPAEIGKRKFYLALFEAHGGQLVMWDGESYDAAIAEAESIRADWDITEPVHDLVVGGAQ